MQNSRPPTLAEFEALIAFLPKLYAQGFQPVRQWHGGKPDNKGVISLPYPEYDPLVEEFFRTTAQECWCDYGYDPASASQMIREAQFIKNSSLDQVRTMLTYCLRGERFSDGHWEAMIVNGTIRSILERLAELASLM